MATSEKYIPSPPPITVSPELRQYLDIEFPRVAALLNSDSLYSVPLAAAPDKPENGVIVYADGANWNPGSGEGFYGYENGSWVKL